MEEDNVEPLAKTRTRRSNAGARMHEMMFAAEEDEQLAQALGISKGGEDSSEDEDFIPNESDLGPANKVDVSEGDRKDAADEGEDSDSSEGSTFNGDDVDDSDDDSDSDSSDEDEESDDDSADEDNEDSKTSDEVSRIHSKKSTNQVDPKTIKHSRSDYKVERNIKLEFPNGNADALPQIGSPSKQALEACARICCVCLGKQSDEDDEVIECDSCGISVHESCYGVVEDEIEREDEVKSVRSNLSSESTEPWFCEPCLRSIKNPHCELCPNTGGIFKETDTGRWVHMVCALYTRGVTFENVSNLTEVSLFELNYALYGSKTCTLCEDRRLARSGICIGCDAGLCKNFFHATCAQKEGLLFESHSDEVDPYFAQCKQHADKTVIKKKKRTYIALYARMKRIQPLIYRSERVKERLLEITKQPDPHVTKWNTENPPPLPQKVSRMLLTSPSVILKLTRKSELLGLDPKSPFMSVPDEMEMARQKWHIPPAFTLEFVAYCHDRSVRMTNMKKQSVELMNQNNMLKIEEASLRNKFNDLKDTLSRVRLENEIMVKEAIALKDAVLSSGRPYTFPSQLEQLISRSSSKIAKSPNKNKSSKAKEYPKTSATYGCGKCGDVKDQHLLSLCDTCDCYFHIYCLDPPLTRVPKKTKFGGWQCSDCSEKFEEEQDEAQEEQNTIAIQEADGPRRLRERVKYPDKYCHESMMNADFWSASKRRSKKSKSKKAKKIKS